MEPRNKQTRDRTHEYTNTANMPQYFKHEIDATNNHWKTLPAADYLTDYELPNYNRRPSVATDYGSEDGNKYPFLLPSNPNHLHR